MSGITRNMVSMTINGGVNNNALTIISRFNNLMLLDISHNSVNDLPVGRRGIFLSLFGGSSI